MMAQKYVYSFGDGNAEGNASQKELLGGKGANLAEMNLLGVPVPPGFTISTEACNHYYTLGKDEVINMLKTQVGDGVSFIEEITDKGFGNPENPCLLSVRSGARMSMPGMMDTVLNLGLNDEIVEGFARKTNNKRAAWDSYRRLIQMYGSVVMGLKPLNKEDEDPFELIISRLKKEKGVKLDTDLTAEDLVELVKRFKAAVYEQTGNHFPTDPWDQLWGSILSVFDSWMNNRAKTYRMLNGIPEEWGTAVNVQAMVFGNNGNNSATGVAFTRDPASGENRFMGEYLINAQGEDVVAGVRTPQQINIEGSQRWAKLAGVSEEDRKENYPSLEEVMPKIYGELDAIRLKLEEHYRDMQDLEFTIEDGKLWILQTRDGKRTGAAMVRIAMEMLREGMIDERKAISRISAPKLDELLHPVFDKEALKNAQQITQGLPASPGAATGQIVFFAETAAEWAEQGKTVILARQETSPEDIQGMNAAKGILTTHGGMTSHAAVVARGMGTCCVSGAGNLHIDYQARTITIEGLDLVLREGDWISLNGTTGYVYAGKVPTLNPEISGDLDELLKLARKYANLNVWANADTPADARLARKFGAKGIGLCRTEHMFFQEDRLLLIREMILSSTEAERRVALNKLLPIQRKDFEGLFEAMDGNPITIRLLDPPLHEFIPHEEENQQLVADDLGISLHEVQEKVEALSESNPMMGLRGCRLGNIHPEITEMQTKAILEAALNISEKGIEVFPEIMVPLIGTEKEFEAQAKVIRSTAEALFAERGRRVTYLVGTMIEIPRATLVADRIARHADFFSFGTNDLTQFTFGYSRDDTGDFLPHYIKNGILKADPFQTLDEDGVGLLVKIGTEKGRDTKPDLRVGICGEHGGDPTSIELCYGYGLNYVSCSPYRVPIASIVAAQATIKNDMAFA
jgi:pyruvate,orthophosphate dikinase